jgi:hypothetical protein
VHRGVRVDARRRAAGCEDGVAPAEAEPDGAEPPAVEFRTRAVAGGFTHLYLFTWAWRQGGASAQPGEIQLADLWLEP